MKLKLLNLISFFAICIYTSYGQFPDLNKYNIVWTSQSQNSSESIPCGGGDIGLNVWVENGEILFYLFPACPKKWDVSFKLHAPYNTTVEGVLKGGKLVSIKVTPELRHQDLQIMLK